MNDNLIEQYKELIQQSNVIFLPFTGSQEIMEASSDRKILNKYEMKRHYPGQTFITKEFRLDESNGYILVSKHYLRENIPSLKRAKTIELTKYAENMISVFITSMNKIKFKNKK